MSSRNPAGWLHVRLLGWRMTLYNENKWMDEEKRGSEGESSFRLNKSSTVTNDDKTGVMTVLI